MDDKIKKFREILGLNIRIARTRKGISQEELAEIADISTKHVTKIENAKVTTNIYFVNKIAQALDVTIDELVTEYKTGKKIS